MYWETHRRFSGSLSSELGMPSNCRTGLDLLSPSMLKVCSERPHPMGEEGEEPFTGRAAIGYDHGFNGEVFYLGLALDPAYIEGFVEGCLERIGEDNPDEEEIFRDLWEDETQREIVIESLKADCEVRTGRP